MRLILISLSLSPLAPGAWGARETGTLRVCATAELHGSGKVQASGYAEISLSSSLDASGHGLHGHGSVTLWKQFSVVQGRVREWVYPYSDAIWLYDGDGRYAGSANLHGEIKVSGEGAPGSILRLAGSGDLCADVYVAP